ncbi:response regulator receiver modulated CheB methylesterase [Leptothrix cholodnii SP-6]|uniref:Protein-glutamate methylesterase/protein-glutamine glutaminase n=1 Tax=Leptothrix cholodnii (strain ATCC 51168 / LMG 8142 / SP-6) TaxID=395495 RepID=B1XWC6_LEPCP|nr:chemotaxis response regulator protein-glutamate methylesterase [Leptothrix cholodnii]ACB33794.1 response regulator receiver modulated CheB methylesterase [Leptothrix cholodnii SP-6]
MAAIRVMIVDDSAVVRKHLSDLLTAAGIEVIATAADPLFALPKMRARWPDVLVLDVEMPRMDGISFLRQLMAERPTPVVMCSTLTEAGCETTLQALAAGAVSFVTKPRLGLRAFLEDGSNGLVEAVRAAAGANLGAVMAGSKAVTVARAARAATSGAASAGGSGAAAARPRSDAMALTTDRVIALGLSTGGVQSLERVLPFLPRTLPGMVVVQHMPEKFTAQFAARLDRICEVEVVEARNGDRVINGRVLIAPGGRHLRLKRNGAQYVAEVMDGPLINHHRPSVDVLFRSVAQCAGRNAVGLIMTGMGDDGCRGLREMRDAGAITAAQDEASSIVYGMPKEALRLGAAETVLGLDEIAGWLVQAAQRKAA